MPVITNCVWICLSSLIVVPNLMREIVGCFAMNVREFIRGTTQGLEIGHSVLNFGILLNCFSGFSVFCHPCLGRLQGKFNLFFSSYCQRIPPSSILT